MSGPPSQYQPSSNQCRNMHHGNSSSVTDQTSPPNPYPGPPPLRPLDCTRATQQHLQWGAILYPQTLPCQHTDQSPQLTPHPCYSQPPPPNDPSLIQTYGPPSRQTSQHPPLPLFPQPALHYGVQQRLPQRPITPPHPANLHPQFFPSLNQNPQCYYQQHDLSHHVRTNFHLNWSQNFPYLPIAPIHLPPPLVQPYFSDQSVYGHVNSFAQQSLLSEPTSTVNFASLANFVGSEPHSTSVSQPTSLSDNATGSAESRSPLTPDTPDPKRPCLSPHCSTTTQSNIQHLSEIDQPKLCMASLSTVASECSHTLSNVSSSNYCAVSLTQLSNQKHIICSESSTISFATVEPTTPRNISPSQPTSLSDNSSAESRSPLTPDTTSLSTVASDCSHTPSDVSSSNFSAITLTHLSNQQHTSSQCSAISNAPPSKALPRQTFSLVFETLFPICSEWHNFGLALGLSESTLKIIKHNDSDCKDCLRETLAVRVSDKPLTWRDVIRALRSVIVNNNELAEKIEREFSEQLDVQIQLDDSADQEKGFHNITSTPINIPDCVLRYASYLKDRYKRMPVLPDTWPPPLVGKDHFTNLALIEKRKYLKLPQAKSKHSIEYDYAYGNVDNIVEKKQPIKLENIFEPLPGEDFTQDQFIILMDGAPGVGKTTISRKICKDWSRDELISHFKLVIFVPLRHLVVGCHSDQMFSIADLLPADDPELKSQVVGYLQKASGAGVLFIFDGYDELSYKQRTKCSLFLDIIRGDRLYKSSVLVTSRTYASGPLREISRINRHVEVLGFNKRQINDCIRKNIPEKDKAKLLLEMLKERLDIISLCYIPLNCRIVLYVYQQQYTLPDTLTELYEVFILYTIKHYAEKLSSDEEIEVQIKQANSLESLPPNVFKHLCNLTHTAFSGMTEDKLVFEYNELKEAKTALPLGLLNMIDTYQSYQEKQYYQFLHFTIQEFLAAKYLAKQFTSNGKLQFVKSHLSEDRYRITLLFLAGLTGLDFIPEIFTTQPMIDLSEAPRNSQHSGTKRFILHRTKFLFIAQLLYESRKSTCDWVLSCLKNKVFNFSFHSLPQFECLVLGNFFSVTPEDHIWDVIDLCNCSLKADQLKVLLCKLHSKTNVPIFSFTRELYLVRSFETVNNKVSFSWLLSLISGYSKVKRIIVPQFSQSEKSSCQLSPILNDSFTFKSLSVYRGGHVTDIELDLEDMSLYICPKLLSMLLKYFDPKKATKIDLRDHPEVFQDCSRCDTFGSMGWTSLYGTLDTFENLQELAITTFNTEHAISLMNTFSGTKLVTDFSDSLIRSVEVIKLRNLLRAQTTVILFKGLKLSLENNATFTIEINPAIGDSQHCSGYLRTLLGEKLPPNFINFNVTCSFLTEDMGKWLGANSDLKELRVNLTISEIWKHLDDEFSSALAQCVSHSATLEVLKIGHCKLPDNQLETISNSLPHTSSLKELHFNGIFIATDWSALFQAVQQNTSLCKLDCNTTSDSSYSESCRALCDMITNNTVLQELSINAQYISGEYEMFVSTLLQSTTTRQVTVGGYLRSEIDSFKKGLSKFIRDKVQVSSQDCWTLGSVTLNFKWKKT